MNPARVIVCGGRDYKNKQCVFHYLDYLLLKYPQGGARGADAIAAEWAISRKQINEEHPADWKTHGRAAGPIRNEKMASLELFYVWPSREEQAPNI